MRAVICLTHGGPRGVTQKSDSLRQMARGAMTGRELPQLR